jgi:hypothetical protein
MVEPDAAPARVLTAKHAPGRRRGSPRWPLRAACQELADGWPPGSRPTKSAARCRKENAVMARREAPRGFERDHGHDKNNGCATWRAIPLAWARGEKERRTTGLPGASPKNTGGGALAESAVWQVN